MVFSSYSGPRFVRNIGLKEEGGELFMKDFHKY